MNEQEKILFELFIQESLELIDEAENALTLLEEKSDEQHINEVFRFIHSIKGTSLSMGYESLSNFLHNIESFLTRVKRREIELNAELFDLLFDCFNIVKQVINNISNDLGSKIYEGETYNKLKQYVGQIDVEEKSNTAEKFYITEYELLVMDDAIKKNENVYIIKVEIEKQAVMKSMKAFLIINNFNKIGEVLRVYPNDYDKMKDDEFGNFFKVILLTSESEEVVRKNIEVATDVSDIIIEKFRGKNEDISKSNYMFEIKVRKNLKEKIVFRREERSTIRVEISKLDEFYDKLNRLILEKVSLLKATENLANKYTDDNDVKDTLLISSKIDDITKDLETSFMNVRVYTIKNIIARIEKLINNLTARNGKKILFVTEGKRIKIDRRILELIVDPLVHIIRNAVDHGVESADERISKGKNEQAIINLKVIHNRDYVLFEISDDGRGMNLEAIKNVAINRGLISAIQAKNMAEKDVLGLIFTPGFSTAKVVSDISGRGVGMDVVKNNVEKLNGIIDIDTQKDKGTKITLKIPVTLLSIPSLLFKLANDIFAVPQAIVVETLSLSKDEFNKSTEFENNLFIYDKFRMPIINLKEYFNLDVNEAKTVNLIIVGFMEKRLCLIVDDIISNRELIVRRLDENIHKDKTFEKFEGINGISQLEDGNFAYILDVRELIK